MGSRGTRRLFAITAVAGVAALMPAASASAGTLDQQQTLSDFGGLQVDIGASKGQTFTAGLTGQLDQVDLALSGPDATAPLTVQIRDGSATGPGTTVLASASVPASAATDSLSLVPITFASPASVTAGTQYSIVALNEDASALGWFWYAGQGAPPDSAYLGGRLFFTSDGPPATGTWSSGSPADFNFKTYVEPPPASGGGDPGTTTSPATKKKCKKGRKLKKGKCVKKKRKKRK